MVKGFEHDGEKDAMKGRIVILANDIQHGIFQCVSLWDSCFFTFALTDLSYQICAYSSTHLHH